MYVAFSCLRANVGVFVFVFLADIALRACVDAFPLGFVQGRSGKVVLGPVDRRLILLLWELLDMGWCACRFFLGLAFLWSRIGLFLGPGVVALYCFLLRCLGDRCH